MGKIIDGREIAKELKAKIKKFVDERISNGLKVPCLATILIGNDGGSMYYINNQNKLCKELGVETRNLFLSEDITEDELISIIDELNRDVSIDGMILQLPLPKHINETSVTSKINFTKDIDGLSDISIGKFYKGDRCFIPCTPKSIVTLIKSTGCEVSGKNAVVLGRSNIVGKPAAQLLLNDNATVTICHSKTNNLKDICAQADILVSAIGRPGFVNGDFIKEGSIVIDVGTSRVDGKITGDVVFDEAIKKAAFVTPVPGGVGALTTTLLINNVCEALLKNVY